MLTAIGTVIWEDENGEVHWLVDDLRPACRRPMPLYPKPPKEVRSHLDRATCASCKAEKAKHNLGLVESKYNRWRK